MKPYIHKVDAQARTPICAKLLADWAIAHRKNITFYSQTHVSPTLHKRRLPRCHACVSLSLPSLPLLPLRDLAQACLAKFTALTEQKRTSFYLAHVSLSLELWASIGV